MSNALAKRVILFVSDAWLYASSILLQVRGMPLTWSPKCIDPRTGNNSPKNHHHNNEILYKVVRIIVYWTRKKKPTLKNIIIICRRTKNRKNCKINKNDCNNVPEPQQGSHIAFVLCQLYRNSSCSLLLFAVASIGMAQGEWFMEHWFNRPTTLASNILTK